MLPLDDPRWQALHGGYRQPTDAVKLLKRMERGADVWMELWEELHHQGDVDLASYAAIPHLVRIAQSQTPLNSNAYALAATVEIERHRKNNPALPDWLAASYHRAWEQLLSLALRDLATPNETNSPQSALVVVALSHHQLKLGALLNHLDDSELDELTETTLAWAELYTP